MLESAEQTKKIDLNCYLVNHQWLRVVYIILCSMQNTNLQILPKKTLPGGLITDFCQKKKENKKQKKNSKHFCKHLLGMKWIFFNCVIYRTSIDHAQVS